MAVFGLSILYIFFAFLITVAMMQDFEKSLNQSVAIGVFWPLSILVSSAFGAFELLDDWKTQRRIKREKEYKRIESEFQKAIGEDL